MRISIALIPLFLLNGAVSFSVKSSRNAVKQQLSSSVSENDDSSLGRGRRSFISSAATATVAQLLTASSNVARAADSNEENGLKLFKTKSGLKYLELREGSGPTPRYGQLVTFQYTAYIKLPNEEKKKFDSNTYLMKHGNGRVIEGLDEGIHTMKVGGVRRIIIPPKLGYVDNGIGPIPEMPWNRWALNDLLGKMIEVKAGNFVFDVELRAAIDDEADQGYYQDDSMTPEDFEKLKNNLQRKAMDSINSRLPTEAAEV